MHRLKKEPTNNFEKLQFFFSATSALPHLTSTSQAITSTSKMMAQILFSNSDSDNEVVRVV